MSKSTKSISKPLPLQGIVNHSAWGGHDFIPALLGRPELSAKPCAELWLGSHAKAPSIVKVDGVDLPLTQLLAQSGNDILGSDSSRRFGGQLPYLLKVLDARQMLSIQAHPTLKQAAEGYDREDKAGIALSAPTRNYKDRNHKPEVHVALTEFWMLHGFRPLEEIAHTLDKVPELRPLAPEFRKQLTLAGNDASKRANLLRGLYEHAMTLPQPQVDALLNPLLARLEKESPYNKDLPDFWALRGSREFPLPDGHRDRGIFSIYLLNLLHLHAGESTYQPAGTLHAYLEGTNVELMANSDNVLRGGLTPKHVDVPELMRIVNFDSGKPTVIHGRPISDAENIYPTAATEFQLSRIQLSATAPICKVGGKSAQIIILIEGNVTVTADSNSQELKRGEALLLPHECLCQIKTNSPSTVIFKAALP